MTLKMRNMGKLSRDKGKTFERKIADRFRQLIGESGTVRRSLQADRAYEPDIVIEGDLDTKFPKLKSLWVECNDARAPNPADKYQQAVKDLARAHAEGRPNHKIPVVIWHKYGEQKINATLRLIDLVSLHGSPLSLTSKAPDALLTMSFEDFLTFWG